jgi:hypothetical protein
MLATTYGDYGCGAPGEILFNNTTLLPVRATRLSNGRDGLSGGLNSLFQRLAGFPSIESVALSFSTAHKSTG